MSFWRFFLILALSLGVALAVPAIAAEEGGGQADPGAGAGAGAGEPQAQPGAAPGEAAPAAQVREVEGEISSIDAQNQTLRVGGFAGLFGTPLQVTDKTKFMAPGGKAIDFNALKEGDRIRASYQMVQDQNVANEIELLQPAPAAGAGGAAPEGGGAAPKEGGGAAPEGQQPSGGERGPSY
jgi:hypothetical protein